MYHSETFAIKQFEDNLEIPMTTPKIVAKNIPITATKIVFKTPTKYARAYELAPLYSINEN